MNLQAMVYPQQWKISLKLRLVKPGKAGKAKRDALETWAKPMTLAPFAVLPMG